MDNIRRVTAHAARRALETGGEDASRRTLTLVPTKDGRPCLEDDTGRFWRCYLFIEKARTYDLVETPDQAFQAARAFGDFQRLLTDMPGGRLCETIPDFHHTPRRFDAFRRAVAGDSHNRAATVRDEIAFALEREPLVGRLIELHASGEMPERVTHNDTKFNNVMIDDLTGEGVCVIDLDTVMPGLSLYDFGDMVRSATNSAFEDEQNVSKVSMRLPIYRSLVAGYLSSVGDCLTAAERAHLAFAGKLITFETGLRFLTDYLEGDHYFRTRRPGHNLDRCRSQFALVRSMESQQSDMEYVVRQLTGLTA
jgi:aminoglycoside phosphotransferase (APT) family kinase protein